MSEKQHLHIIAIEIPAVRQRTGKVVHYDDINAISESAEKSLDPSDKPHPGEDVEVETRDAGAPGRRGKFGSTKVIRSKLFRNKELDRHIGENNLPAPNLCFKRCKDYPQLTWVVEVTTDSLPMPDGV